jgi:hypothetical protein
MLTATGLVAEAIAEAGLDDFGGDGFRDGLERLVGSLEGEAELTDLGRAIMEARLRGLLVNRLRIEDAYRTHPEIAAQRVGAPLFIVGLPRTGTTALSNLLAADPQIRSLRMWESGDSVPPPETATEHDDPRIATATAGLAAMYETFPKMRALHFQSPTGPTECQDLLGMELRTAHFDGMARVPTYTRWVLDCDMAPAYRYHRRTLQLLQWRCGPPRWHLKTPVHMLSLDALAESYPDARFLWTHRDPAAVLGSVCSLISYTRSWVSDRDDDATMGVQQLDLWAEALRRAMAFRARVGEARFADVAFEQLQADPVTVIEQSYDTLGVDFGPSSRAAVGRWAAEHPPGAHGTHEFALSDFGLDAGAVRRRLASYLDRFSVPLVDVG